ncbi:hypothetical protein, partial [Chitinimonas sp. JJ19]|uniref:hypothetical protein n=1 Tax=Chitinimonas sp. JJ19 TaxID=3109352 RepID=UPI003001A41D
PLSYTDPSGLFLLGAAGAAQATAASSGLGVGASTWRSDSAQRMMEELGLDGRSYSSVNASGAKQAINDPAARAEYDAYKARCNQSPPPGMDPCALAQWKLRRNKDCRNMRQGWDDKWLPGRHADDILNLDRGIQKLEQWIADNCKGCQIP